MISILVLGHGSFAFGMCKAVEMIGGLPKHIHAIDFHPDQTMEDMIEQTQTCLNQESEYDGGLLLCDIACGTPYKAAAIVAFTNRNVRVIAGFNLIFLLEVCNNVPSLDSINSLDVFLNQKIDEARQAFYLLSRDEFDSIRPIGGSV